MIYYSSQENQLLYKNICETILQNNPVYNKLHIPPVPRDFFINKWVLIASSNTCFTPWLFFALHSTYFTALIVLLSSSPCWYEMGESPFCASASLVFWSSRKSTLVPTRIIGVPPEWWCTSGYHYNIINFLL